MNKIKKAIEILNNPEADIDYTKEEINQAHLLAIKTLIKQLPNKTFEWQKCKRKNGTEFLKLIYYSPSVNGYIEVGRFNMSKQELVQNEWSLDEILRELQ